MLDLKLNVLLTPLNIPSVDFAFVEHLEDDIYELYTGKSALDFSCVGKVSAKTDDELNSKVEELIRLLVRID